MAFEPGQSGNPGGRRKEQPWTDALRIAALEKKGDVTMLRAIADKTVEMALEGDQHARKEIGERLDGKAKQAVELTGAEGGPIETVDLTDPAKVRDVARRVAFLLTSGANAST